ncbi:MAG TPA: hypothetical protein DCX08_07550 [Porticoccaceae bacterium]|jgi:chromosome segregation ATPase|nr:hypothetical protein [Porticoccaceae bacterium]
MDKKPRSPIIAQRDDMIGRNIGGSRGDSTASKTRSNSSANTTGSGGNNVVVIFVLVGLVTAVGFGWLQYQDLLKRHDSLQTRFDLLESRLSSTDESVTQSGAAMQLNISKNKDELKKHWSEIRKLWGVTNDINKTKIASNKKDIAFLVKQRASLDKSVKALAAKIDKNTSLASDVGVNYLALTEELETLKQGVRSYSDQLNRLKAALAKTDNVLTGNVEAIRAMDSFRRKTTQQIYDLEQRAAPATSVVPTELPASDVSGP